MNNSKVSIFTVFFLVPMCIPFIMSIITLVEGIILFVYIMLFASLIIIIPAGLTATISIWLRHWILNNNLSHPTRRWMAYTSITGLFTSFIYGMLLNLIDNSSNFKLPLALSIAGLICSLIACSILISRDHNK